MESKRVGGVAALVEAATFVFGFAFFVTVLSDYTSGDLDAAASVSFVADNEIALYVWNFVILIIFGIALVPLVLALNERLKAGALVLAQTASAFGIIWAGLLLAAGMITNIGLGTVVDLHDTDPALARPVWSSLDSIQNGLSGGNELVGGLWVLLVSWAALRSGVLPKGLNYLGSISGVAGIVTLIPALEEVGAVFGLGMIVWFAWLGMTLLSEEKQLVVSTERELVGA